MGTSLPNFAILIVAACMFLCSHAVAQELPSATQNSAQPFISAVADQIVSEDSPTIPIRVLFGDPETPTAELRLWVASSNERLLPPHNVLFNATIHPEMVIVPAHNQFGSSRVTLTVRNAHGKTASQSFQVTVLPVNDPPELSLSDSWTILEDQQPVEPIAFQVTDPESISEDLIVTVQSSDETLLPVQNIRVTGTGKDRRLAIQPAPDQHGSAMVILSARDPQGAQSRVELTVRVLPVNDPPRLASIPDQRISVNQTLGPIPIRATDDELAAADLVLEGFSSNPHLVPSGAIQFGTSKSERTISVTPARGVTGTALITIKAYDHEKLESNTSFLLTVAPENILPQISALADIMVDQGHPPVVVPIQVTDPDGPQIGLRVQAGSSNPDLLPSGALELRTDAEQSVLVLTPVSGRSGMAEILLTVTDADGGQTRDSFLFTVRPPVLRPSGRAASVLVTEDTPVEIVLETDNLPTGPLRFLIVSPPQKGRLIGEPPRLTYVPAPNVTGLDTFEFKVTDETGETAPARVSISIREVNDPPFISPVADRRIGMGKRSDPIQFGLDDVETDAANLIVTARSSNPLLIPDQNIALGGRESVRDISLTPVAGRTGMAMITLTVTDTGGSNAMITFAVIVSDQPLGPYAEPQFVLTPEDVSAAILLRGREPDGQTLTFTIVNQPGRGLLSGFPPNVVYRPTQNATGPDQFTFQVTTPNGESSQATVQIMIVPVNDAPQARSRIFTINEDTPLDLGLEGSDADNDPLTWEVVSFPTKGKLSGTPPKLVYTPNLNEAGVDQFTFTTSDPELGSNPGTIRITINPVNDPPSALGAFASTLEDTVVAISLKGSDVDGDSLSYSVGTLPVKGVLAGTPPDLIYIPHPNATGLDRFTFRVSDGKQMSDPAVASVMLVPANDPPVAESQFLSLIEDTQAEVLLSGRDVDSDTLSFIVVTAPAKGSLSGTIPRLIYRPDPNFNGLDSFTYKVNDGTADSQPAVVTLSVRSINDPPVAEDQFVIVDEDTSHGIVLRGRDIENSLLNFHLVDLPRNGSVAGVPPQLTYTPARDFNGEDRFTFTVSDGDRESAPATLKVSIRPVNDAPVAENQFLTVASGRPRIVTLTGRDAEGGPTQFILTSLPSKGILSGKPPDLVYLPNPNERGLDSFNFKVSDGAIESLPGTVQLVLTEKTSGPSISTIPDQTTRAGEATAKIPFIIGDAETSFDKLVVRASSSAPDIVPVEAVVIEGSTAERSVQITPASSRIGTSTITLVVWDEDGLAASVQFVLTVLPAVKPNQIPTVGIVGSIDLSVIDLKTPVVFRAQASDSDGTIERVEFYAGTTLLGVSRTSPYQFTWNTPARGQHSITARAVDDRAGEATSVPVQIRIDQPGGRAAILIASNQPDVDLIRKHLFELPVQSTLVLRADAKLENLSREFDVIIWHQPSGADLNVRDVTLLEALANSGVPLYFLGDSLVAARRSLNDSERSRWYNLVHLKPGGASWLSYVNLSDESDHPLIRNGPVGSVNRFFYPVTPLQSGVQTGMAGEVVVGRSGTFDLLVAAVDPRSSHRTFTHHLSLSGAADPVTVIEQAKLFKNAIGWLLAKRYFMDLTVEIQLPNSGVSVGQAFQYQIMVRHSGESSASQVSVIQTLPPGLTLVSAEVPGGSWTRQNETVWFDLGNFEQSETRTITVSGIASRPGPMVHSVQLQMLGTDAVYENNTFTARMAVLDARTRGPILSVRKENSGLIRLELSAADPGTNYQLEGSEDMIRWTPVSDRLNTFNPTIAIPTSSVRFRFFRTVSADAAANPPQVQN